MNIIRSNAMATISRWGEVLAAAALLLFGLWLATRGGWFLAGVGGAVGLVATGLGLGAWRRVRFARPVAAPGMVEVDEAQVAYFGPDMGGFVSLRELIEIRLIVVQGRAQWRLKQADGQALLIPVAAEGAGALYDAFAALPGIDMQAVTDAQEAPADSTALHAPLWRRPDYRSLAPNPG